MGCYFSGLPFCSAFFCPDDNNFGEQTITFHSFSVHTVNPEVWNLCVCVCENLSVQHRQPVGCNCCPHLQVGEGHSLSLGPAAGGPDQHGALGFRPALDPRGLPAFPHARPGPGLRGGEGGEWTHLWDVSRDLWIHFWALWIHFCAFPVLWEQWVCVVGVLGVVFQIGKWWKDAPNEPWSGFTQALKFVLWPVAASYRDPTHSIANSPLQKSAKAICSFSLVESWGDALAGSLRMLSPERIQSWFTAWNLSGGYYEGEEKCTIISELP